MNFNIGIIVEYQDNEGLILSNGTKYFFIKESLLDEIKLNDYVIFRPENNKAFFIKKLDNDVYDQISNNKSLLEINL